MSWILWLLFLLFGFGSFFGVTEESSIVQQEAGSGSAEAPEAIEIEPVEPNEAPENGFADPFPDDLGVPRTDRQIEERFTSRWPLWSCGAINVATDPGEHEWQCLQDAVGGKEGAELVVFDLDAAPMMTTTYRVNPDGPMEVFINTSKAPGTKGTWDYRQCQPSDDLRTEPCAS